MKDHSKQSYLDKLYGWLIDQPAGEYDIEKFVRPESREKFINSIKEYISSREFWEKGFELSFNEDYTTLKKTKFKINENKNEAQLCD